MSTTKGSIHFYSVCQRMSLPHELVRCQSNERKRPHDILRNEKKWDKGLAIEKEKKYGKRKEISKEYYC